MAKTLISLDDQQILRMEIIIMEQDGPLALKYLEELRNAVRRARTGCNPLEFKTREDVAGLIDEKKNRCAEKGGGLDKTNRM